MLDSVPIIGPGYLAQGSHSSGLSGKLCVPVRSEGTICATFRHVVAVSSGKDGGGVPLLRLRILDNLIDSYLRAQKDSPVAQDGEAMEVPVSADTVDATISALAADLHEALSGRASPFGGAFVETGTVLSLGA